MLDDTPRPAHVQRCTYTELRGKRYWQCLRADPHPDVGHQLPIDARFGQPLHEMHPEKLAALLRDQAALTDNLQGRVDTLQSIAIDLVIAWRTGSRTHPDTAAWLANTVPDTARELGLIE